MTRFPTFLHEIGFTSYVVVVFLLDTDLGRIIWRRSRGRLCPLHPHRSNQPNETSEDSETPGPQATGASAGSRMVRRDC